MKTTTDRNGNLLNLTKRLRNDFRRARRQNAAAVRDHRALPYPELPDALKGFARRHHDGPGWRARKAAGR